MCTEIKDFGGPPLTFQERISEALEHAANELEKIIKEAVEQTFLDSKFPKTKFWVEHEGKEILRSFGSFDGLIISPYAHYKIFPQETYENSLMFTLQHRDPSRYNFVLLPNGLYVFESMAEENWGPVHPIINTEVKAPPIALLLLTNEILNAINANAIQKEKSEELTELL